MEVLRKRFEQEFGEKLVSEEISCYLTHNGDIFSKGWLIDFLVKEIEKARKEGYAEGASNAVVTDIQEAIDKAREEVLTELQEEFSEFGVPDDVRYTKPLFYINEIIEEKLSKLKQ